MRDSRNINRGKCMTKMHKDDECIQYSYNREKGNKCDYCGCLPINHKFLVNEETPNTPNNQLNVHVRDARNVMRGKCEKNHEGGCPQYNFISRNEIQCDYCGCPPIDHEKIKEESANLEENGKLVAIPIGATVSVPFIFYVNGDAFQNEFMDLLRELEFSSKFLNREYRKFIKIYPIWKGSRQSSITALRKIANHLADLKRTCDKTKRNALVTAMCSEVSLIAATLCIGLTSIALPFAVPFAIIVGVAAGCTNMATDIYENTQENESLKKIEELILKDEKDCEDLVKFINRAKRSYKVINKLMPFETFRLFYEACRSANETYLPAEEQHRKFIKIVNSDPRMLGLKEFMKMCPNLLSLLPYTMNMQRANPNILRSIGNFKNSAFRAISCNKAQIDLNSLVLRGVRTAAPAVCETLAKTVLKQGSKIAMQNTVSCLCLMLDIRNYRITVENIEKGSISNIAENIRIVIKHLEEDISLLDPFYDSLKQNTKCSVTQTVIQLIL